MHSRGQAERKTDQCQAAKCRAPPQARVSSVNNENCDSAVCRAMRMKNSPPAVDKFELAVLYELLSHVPALITLLIPPSCEKGDLDVDKVAVGILEQLVHDSVNNIVDLTRKVLVDSNLPSSIVVRICRTAQEEVSDLWHLCGSRPPSCYHPLFSAS